MLKLRHKREFFVGLSVAITIFLALAGFNSVLLYHNDKAATINQFESLANRVNADMSLTLRNIDGISRTNFINEEFSENSARLFTSSEHSEAVGDMQSLFETIISNNAALIAGVAYFPYDDAGEVESENQIIAGAQANLMIDNEQTIIDSVPSLASLYVNWASYSDGNYAAYLFFSRQILDMRVDNYNEPIGIASICVSIPTLSAPLGYASAQAGSSFYLLDRENRILLSSDSSISSIEQVQGKGFYHLSLHLGFLDWQFYAAQDTAVVWINLRIIFLVEICLLLFLVVGYTVIYLLAYQRSQRGLSELFDFFSSHESSSLDKMPPSSDEEVNRVVGAYNVMVESVIALNEQIVEERNRGLALELEKSKMEIHALHSQINKHFLVNTLSVIRSYISLHDVEQAKLCLENLSDFLRYSLNNEESSMIGQELDASKNYLLIQQARYPDVEYEIDCPDELKCLVIPKVAFQPLLENAFTHGLTNKKGKIRIEIHQVGEMVYLDVANTGLPRDPKRIDMVNEALSSNTAFSSNQGNGIAMNNIQRRFRLMFEESAKVSLFTEEGETIARIAFLRKGEQA